MIDWDERLLLELKEHLVDISPDKIFQMRQQGAMLYNLYFSSIDQIIQSTFEIIRERIFPEEKRDSFIWNTNPGESFFKASSRNNNNLRRWSCSYTWYESIKYSILFWAYFEAKIGEIHSNHTCRSNCSKFSKSNYKTYQIIMEVHLLECFDIF